VATIFHIALAGDWAAAQEAGAYTTSTRGRSLAEEGFVHCSRADQWPAVRDAFYADVTEPLLLLQIDTTRLDVPVVEEAAEPGRVETFPHVYGPIPLDAVVKAIPLPHGTGTRAPQPSFASIFFREMFGNALLICLVLVAGLVGLWIGDAFGDEVAPLAGGLCGIAVGLVAARLLYARRA